jgi:hypothetical protein
MQITKLQAWKEGLQESRICNFHMNQPDQAATMETCERCKIIHDPCGCDEDSYCDDCDTVRLHELPQRKIVIKHSAKFLKLLKEGHELSAMSFEGREYSERAFLLGKYLEYHEVK